MRTTLDIDADILLAVKQIAQQTNTTLGSVVSSLLRESLRPKPLELDHRNGVPLLPRRPHALAVTADLVNQLRDEVE